MKYFTACLFVVAYAFTTWYYMGPSITHCTSTVYGFGDNTAGPIWRNGVSPGSPLWGYENVTNYPDGENLYSPVHYSGLIQYTTFWVMAKAAGPVCGYNLLNIFGFMTSALIMAAFVYWLFRSTWISLLAGYAAAFTPYYQLKVGGHPSYGYQSILIGLMWMTMLFIKRRTLKSAIGLSVLLAICTYFDPYFMLYGVSTVAAVALGYALLLVFNKQRAAKIRQLMSWKQEEGLVRPLVQAVALYIMLLLPLLLFGYANRSQIQKDVSSVRGNVLFEAKACSNYPIEYFVPFVLHPLPKVIGAGNEYKRMVNALKDNFSCGIGEDTVGLSLTAVAIVSACLIVVAWERNNKRKINVIVNKSVGNQELIVVAMAVAAAGVALALPPVSLAGILPTPTKLLLSITTTWRTLARSYMMVNIGLVILLAFSLQFFKRLRMRQWLKTALFIVVAGCIMVEYQAFRPFSGNELSSFSYAKSAPDAYVHLKAMTDSNVIAEYPLERYGESDAVSYYLTMQRIHGKKLLNAVSPTTEEEQIRASIKNIRDPQSIAILRGLGVDTVVLHGVTTGSVSNIAGLEVVYEAKQSAFNILSNTSTVKADTVVIAKILPEADETLSRTAVGILSTGFYRNLGIIKDVQDWAYESVDGATISVKTANLEPLAQPERYCFAARVSAQGEQGTLLRLEIDGVEKTLPQPLSNDYQKFEVQAKDKIVLHNSKKSNMQLTSLGCSAE